MENLTRKSRPLYYLLLSLTVINAYRDTKSSRYSGHYSTFNGYSSHFSSRSDQPDTGFAEFIQLKEAENYITDYATPKASAQDKKKSTISKPYTYGTNPRVKKKVKDSGFRTYSHKVLSPESSINQGSSGSTIAFVFDTTGSMWDDLMAVREGARKILKTALNTPNSPINSFLLVPFADPKIGPVTLTKDPDVFQDALEQLWVSGGRDCPEMSLGGIKKALELSQPYSQIYVFTDASSKDHHLINEVLQLIQEKQAQVVFVLTGDCGNRSSPNYMSYEQVAVTSSGQVFHLQKKKVKTVVSFIEKNIIPNKVYLLTRDYRSTNTHSINLPIDPTIQELTISISGDKRHLSILDPTGKKVYPLGRRRYNGGFRRMPQNIRSILSLPSALIVNIKEPKKGIWRFDVAARDVHSIRVTAVSSFDFNARFSRFQETKYENANIRPIGKATNSTWPFAYTFTPIVLKGYDPSTTQIWSLAFVDTHGKAIASRPLQKTGATSMVPQKFMQVPVTKTWYVQIEGAIDGYDFVRLSKSAIVPKVPEAPKIELASELVASFGYDYILECTVISDLAYKVFLTNVKTQNEKGPIEMADSGIVKFQLKNVDKNQAGLYRCSAASEAGWSSSLTNLKVGDPPPKVDIELPEYNARIYKDLAIECFIKTDKIYKMQWSFLGKVVSQVPILDLRRVDWHDSGKYTCTAITSDGVKASASTIVKVMQSPKIQIRLVDDSYSNTKNNYNLIKKIDNFRSGMEIFLDKNSRVRFSCTLLQGIPAPEIFWYKDEEKLQQGISDLVILSSVENQGKYSCRTENVGGQHEEFVDIKYREVPKIIKDLENGTGSSSGTEFVLNQGRQFQKKCQISQGYPKPEVYWTFTPRNQLGYIDPNNKQTFSNNENLFLSNLNSNNIGEYSCIAVNKHSTDEHTISIDVGFKPKMLERSEEIELLVVKLGDKIELDCATLAHPPVTELRWFFDETTISSDSNLATTIQQSPIYENTTKALGTESVRTLEMTVDIEHNTKLLKCKGKNKFGTMEYTFRFIVEDLETPSLIESNLHKPEYNKNQFHNEGNNIVLKCPIEGNPMPKISWIYTTEQGNITPISQEIFGDKARNYTQRAETG